MKRTFCAIALLGLASLLARAADWPQFRGPDGQGHSTAGNLPLEWSDTTKNVAWKTPIPGEGWSSPVLQNGRIYLTSATPEGSGNSLSLRTLCLDAATGKILWNVAALTTTAGQMHNKNSQASATPVLEADRLYVHFGPMGTACLNLAGTVLWRNTELKYPPVHGNGGSPVIVDNALIFSCDGASNPFIVALHKATGRVLWKQPRETGARKKFSFSTPLVITVRGQKQVVSQASGAVFGYEPKTGRELWRVRYGDGYSVVPRPVFGHGLVYVSSGFDRASVLAIRPEGTGDITASHVAWTNSRGAPTTPSLLLVEDELYMVADSGMVTCIDAATGRQHWQERIGGSCSASPVFADGKIYVQTEAGVTVVLKPGKAFQKLAENPLHERTLASCAVDEGALFIRTQEHLFRINGRGS